MWIKLNFLDDMSIKDIMDSKRHVSHISKSHIMDNKDKDKKDKDSGQGHEFKWRSLGFFSAEDYLIYIFKKTEKITAALYLVSGLLKDDEPLKWQLRDRGMDLVTSSFSISSSIPQDRSVVIQSIFTSALETISLLNVAKVSNLISEMNYSILVKEIDNVISLLRDRLAESAQNAGYVLSESFFKTGEMYSSSFKSEFGLSRKSKNDHAFSQNASNSDGVSNSNPSINRTNRTDRIIAVLKERNSATIKDVSLIVTDCSEKTIQRELIELMNKGLVKRDGERRWSRYSLIDIQK